MENIYDDFILFAFSCILQTVIKKIQEYSNRKSSLVTYAEFFGINTSKCK